MLPVVALVLLLTDPGYGLVQFTNSALYDIYDFTEAENVSIPLCNEGCFIYASIVGSKETGTPRDKYAENLIIEDATSRTKQSITFTSYQLDEQTSQKLPLIIEASGDVIVTNLNDLASKNFQSILLYVVKASVATSTDYEIYDSSSIDRPFSPPAGVITVMSASQYSISAEKGEANSVITRLVGFDNALEDNEDNCPIAYATPSDVSEFAGFTYSVGVPIIAFVFEKKTPVKIGSVTKFYETQNYYDDGFITGAGWNGCRNEKNGGYQSFRSPLYFPNDAYMLMTNEYNYDVYIEAEMHMDENHTLQVIDLSGFKAYNWQGTYEEGTDFSNITINNVVLVEMKLRDMQGDQGFILRHTATPVIPTTSVEAMPTTEPASTSVRTTAAAPTSTPPVTTVVNTAPSTAPSSSLPTIPSTTSAQTVGTTSTPSTQRVTSAKPTTTESPQPTTSSGALAITSLLVYTFLFVL